VKRMMENELRNLFHEEHADPVRDTFASGLLIRRLGRGE